MLERSFTKICIYSVYGLPGFINNLFIRPQIARIMIQKICLISYKLELALQGESVDGQEGSSIDQLYDKIWKVYREYAQQCSLFFIIKLTVIMRAIYV